MKNKNKTKKKASDIIITIIIVLVVAGFVGALLWKFWGLVHKDGSSTTKESVSMTEVDKLIKRNLDDKYPETPTAVAKVYCSITKELHGSHDEELTQEQITGLYGQLRKLFDDKLLDNNGYEEQLKKLNEELKQYKERKMIISRYTVQDSKDVQIYTDEDGNDCTKVAICYSIKEGSNWMKQNEQIIMRKDADGRWKILGNEALETTEVNGDEK